MKLRATHGVAIAALIAVSGALPARSFADEMPASLPSPAPLPAAATIVQIAAVTDTAAQLASAAQIVTSPPPSPALLAEDVAPLDEDFVPLGPIPAPPPPKPPVPVKAAKHHGHDQLASLAGDVPRTERHRGADTADADQKVLKVKAVGPCQVGRAAWYGGHYIVRRTSSGSRLDQIHATAAHRTLPLNSLVRVTNLDNGRSVVVRITDRGPVSEKLLIDMSPMAAEILAMKTAGIVPVTIEQVVEVPDDAK
jgi:hypothetical protein